MKENKSNQTHPALGHKSVKHMERTAAESGQSDVEKGNERRKLLISRLRMTSKRLM